MKKSILYIIGLAILAGIGVIIYKGAKSGSNTAGSSTSASSTLKIISSEPLPLTQTYTDINYKFSVKYPDGFTASTFANPDSAVGGDVVVIEASSTDASDQASNPQGMQIIITPFSERLNALSVDRIKQDQPDMIINQPQDVILGSGDNAGKGVAFIDNNDSSLSGPGSRQIWFLFSGHLYQITSPMSFDPTLKAMMNTWSFQ